MLRQRLMGRVMEAAERLWRGKPATELLWGGSVVSSQGIFPDSTRHIGAFGTVGLSISAIAYGIFGPSVAAVGATPPDFMSVVKEPCELDERMTPDAVRKERPHPTLCRW